MLTLKTPASGKAPRVPPSPPERVNTERIHTWAGHRREIGCGDKRRVTALVFDENIGVKETQVILRVRFELRERCSYRVRGLRVRAMAAKQRGRFTPPP